MALNVDNPEEVRAWITQTCQTIALLGFTVAEQQERIEALEALQSPFPIPMIAPVPVRDLSIGQDVDNPGRQSL